MLGLVAMPIVPAALAGQGGQLSQYQPQPGVQGQQGDTGQHQMGQNQMGRGQQGQVIASEYTAHLTGTVTSVDQSTGRMTLRGPEGDINVRFPSTALQNVKTGDRVTVAIGLLEQSQPSASPNTSGPSGRGSYQGGASSGSMPQGGSSSGSTYGGSSSSTGTR
jgi:hypothetical protein